MIRPSSSAVAERLDRLREEAIRAKEIFTQIEREKMEAIIKAKEDAERIEREKEEAFQVELCSNKIHWEAEILFDLETNPLSPDFFLPTIGSIPLLKHKCSFCTVKSVPATNPKPSANDRCENIKHIMYVFFQDKYHGMKAFQSLRYGATINQIVLYPDIDPLSQRMKIERAKTRITLLTYIYMEFHLKRTAEKKAEVEEARRKADDEAEKIRLTLEREAEEARLQAEQDAKELAEEEARLKAERDLVEAEEERVLSIEREQIARKAADEKEVAKLEKTMAEMQNRLMKLKSTV